MTNPTLDQPTAQARAGCSVLSDAKAVGHLRVSLIYPDKEEVLVDEKNVITLLGKTRLLETLYLGVSNPVISTLRVGSGGTIDPEGRFPRPATADLTALFNQIQSVSTIYTLDPTYPSVTYIADIDPTLCNGSLVSEAGLFFADDVMFNIKTFPGIPKTVDFSIHFEWTIRIS